MLLNLPGGMPFEAEDPATYCTRSGVLQRSVGADFPVACPPVLWLAPRTVHLRASREGLPEELPHAPLWWTGGCWRELQSDGGHAHAPSAYAPRRFEPPWRAGGGGLVRVTECLPLEDPGPLQDAFGDGNPTVLRVLNLLLSSPDGQTLWARRAVGGAWSRFPVDLPAFALRRTDAFEVAGGERYLLLLRGGGTAGALDTVLLFDASRSEWLPPLPPTRPAGAGNTGEPPVRWRPVRAAAGPGLWAQAWLLESSPDYVLLLAPVCRDGMQRIAADDPHSALHFVGQGGEVVSHHLACRASNLTAQRYDQFMVFVKDPHEHMPGREAACLDDEWHPSYTAISGWVLDVNDVSVPPLPAILPDEMLRSPQTSSWSLVLARGSLQELVTDSRLQQDMAPRLYLLEDGPMLRLWATRRVDEAFHAVFENHTFEGRRLVRSVLEFAPLGHSEVEIGGVGGAWLLWSGDVRHTARLARAGPGGGRLAFWRCAVHFADAAASLRTMRPHATAAAAQAMPVRAGVCAPSAGASPAQLLAHPGDFGWEACWDPSQNARNGAVVTGLPCFPTLRFEEGCFGRPEDFWQHPVSRDAVLLPPLTTFY